MRCFSDYNPIVISVYFFGVSGFAMFCMNPIILLLSLFGALLFFLMQSGNRKLKSHIAFAVLFVIMTVLNPLVSHNGATVMFVLNDRPITAEALLYGVIASVMIISVIYWFRSFTWIMTSDKLLYVFGKLSPKLALILSMGLRYVPLIGKQAEKVNRAQTALGLYKDDNIIDKARGGIRVFSVIVTWALENGIFTADSMASRGYGIGRRSHYSIFSFRRSDRACLALTLILFIMTSISVGANALDFVFYPTVRMAELSALSLLGYISYGALVLLPAFIEAEEKIKWKYLRSRI